MAERKKKEKPKGEYRNLRIIDGIYYFDVMLKDKTWYSLSGLSSEVSRTDAEAFAQKTADSWRKR
jgi:hypothetical protein